MVDHMLLSCINGLFNSPGHLEEALSLAMEVPESLGTPAP